MEGRKEEKKKGKEKGIEKNLSLERNRQQKIKRGLRVVIEDPCVLKCGSKGKLF